MSSKAVPDPLVPVEASLYRRACGRFATGITVVTVLDESGHPHGVTMNSFTSVSLDPPLVLVSIDLKNAILGHFISSTWFAINILAEHQEHLSRRFSSATEERFVGVDWYAGASGMPILDGVIASLECAVVKTFEAGDHTMLIGEVRHAEYREGRPLVYFASGYRTINP